MRQFVIPTIFQATDKMSPALMKMERNVSSFSARASAHIDRLDMKFRKFGDRARAFGKSSLIFGAALLAPLGLAVNEAIKFEEAMADVAKVANVAIGSNQFNALGDQAKNLGVELGIGGQQAAGLMANLAQGGVAVKDLDEVSRIAGKVGVAFGISGDMAGEYFIKTQNALGGTMEETQRVMDVINMFGNTTAAASDQLITFMAKGGSAVALAAGAGGQELAAFGSRFISMGKSAEESATIMQRFIKTSLNSDKLRPVFDKAGGGAAGMLAIIEKGSKLAGREQDKYFKNFGEYGLQLQLLAKDFGGLKDAVDQSNDVTKTAGSVQEEFDNRTKTTAFQIAQAKAQITNLAIEVGNALLPVIKNLLEEVSPMVQKFSEWAQQNKGTISTVVKFTAGLGALAVVAGGLGMAISVASKAMVVARGAMWAFNAIAKVVTITQKALNLAMNANPVGLLIAGVTALVGAMGHLASSYRGVTAEQQAMNDVKSLALKNSVEEKESVKAIFRQLKLLNPETEAYKNKLSELNNISPEIVKNYNLQEGKLRDLEAAEKDLIKQIERRAEVQAAQELLVEAKKEQLRLQSNEGGLSWGSSFSAAIQSMNPFANTDDIVKNAYDQDLGENQKRINELSSIVSGNEREALNPEDLRTQRIVEETSNVNKQELKLKIEGMPEWMNIIQTNSNGGGGAIPVTTSTQ